MSTNVIRTAEGWYVQQGSEAFCVDAQLPTTAELITNGLEVVHAAASATEAGVPADGLPLLSPITTPCRVVAQAVNYRSHARQTGFGEDPPAVLFRKSSRRSADPSTTWSGPATCGCSTTRSSWACHGAGPCRRGHRDQRRPSSPRRRLGHAQRHQRP